MTAKPSTTPALKRAREAYVTRRRGNGDKLVRFWMTAEHHRLLAELVAEHGSYENALAWLLLPPGGLLIREPPAAG